MFPNIICSPFVEHPVIDVAQSEAHEFDVVAYGEEQSTSFVNKGKFNNEQYCKCLLHKLFTIPKSKTKPFIQYQCDNIANPIVWLNKLEKLFDLNSEFFTTKEQAKVVVKVLTVIEVMRDVIEQKEQVPDSKFNFVKLKSEVKQYACYEEKLSCLMEARTQYLQNKPKIIDVNEIPFDEKITIEINKIERLEQLTKHPSRHITDLKDKRIDRKIIIRGHINILVDAFYQMLHEKKANGSPYLSANATEITNFIVSNFLDKDEQPLSESTIRTILSPNKPEKRPKNDNKINL